MVRARLETIGSVAHHIIATHDLFKVWGSSSRGCYIGNPSGQILYLTDEPYRGPLTLNLSGDWLDCHSIPTGVSVIAGPDAISIPAIHLIIDIDSPVVWEPSRVKKFAGDLDTVSTRAKQIVPAILGLKTDLGNDSLLRRVLMPDLYADGLQQRLVQIAESVGGVRPGELVDDLTGLLGYGRGLTPSGDDFIMGGLLAINRWQVNGWESQAAQEVNSGIIAAARQKTTALSASLIEAATSGQADERLINALDYLYGETMDKRIVIDGIIGWGSSSGTDALAGMLIFIKAIFI